jgi:hypothetical protein
MAAMHALRMAALAMLASFVGCARCTTASPRASLDGRPVLLDASGKILAWSKQDSPYAHVARLAWDALKRAPNQENGRPAFYAHSRFQPDTWEGVNWPHNPAGLYAMLIDSALLWYAFSGDAEVVALVRKLADHQLAHGTTPDDFAWASVPYASGEPGSLEYYGANDEWCEHCGRGDGLGVLEPDKVGELGTGYLRLFEATGDEHYKLAAIDCADALAKHAREGDEKRSPWPFRVNAKSNAVREEYTADVLPAIMLFDELVRLGYGQADRYRDARKLAWDWLMEYPIKNNFWSAYFEDIPIFEDPEDNPNQYVPMQTAKYLLEHPELDAEWSEHTERILKWVEETFGQDANNERGLQFGARVLSEQRADMAKMASHTARFAAMNALWFEKTGEALAKERAFRSFNWATYMCNEQGVVVVGEDKNEGWWFSDGYGDYIRHFLVGMAAVPEWAPSNEDHLLRSTSIVRNIAYAPSSITYDTFDARGVEVLRLRSRPVRVRAGRADLVERADRGADGYDVQPIANGGFVVRIRRSASPVVIE